MWIPWFVTIAIPALIVNYLYRLIEIYHIGTVTTKLEYIMSEKVVCTYGQAD